MYKVTKTYGPERGFSCAFRQWSSNTNCQYLHGYSLGFSIELESNSLDINNWVYDFGKFSFLETWLKERFDHTLLVSKTDPELDLIKSLNHKAAKIVELEKISCEYFAEITFKFLEEHFSNLDVTVNSVIVSEHSGNSAGYYRS
jgi:6-pyruvoyltetrahydropterin/6-carboxytetrahydropterin synthase